MARTARWHFLRAVVEVVGVARTRISEFGFSDKGLRDHLLTGGKLICHDGPTQLQREQNTRTGFKTVAQPFRAA